MHYQYLQPIKDERNNTTLIPYWESSDFLSLIRHRTYAVVFNGTFNMVDETMPERKNKTPDSPEDFEFVLDAIYWAHNRDDRPKNKEIRSMCVGDLIMLLGRVFVVERAGFAELTGSNIPKFDNPEPVVN
jgi:hypothetical protein